MAAATGAFGKQVSLRSAIYNFRDIACRLARSMAAARIAKPHLSYVGRTMLALFAKCVGTIAQKTVSGIKTRTRLNAARCPSPMLATMALAQQYCNVPLWMHREFGTILLHPPTNSLGIHRSKEWSRSALVACKWAGVASLLRLELAAMMFALELAEKLAAFWAGCLCTVVPLNWDAAAVLAALTEQGSSAIFVVVFHSYSPFRPQRPPVAEKVWWHAIAMLRDVSSALHLVPYTPPRESWRRGFDIDTSRSVFRIYDAIEARHDECEVTEAHDCDPRASDGRIPAECSEIAAHSSAPNVFIDVARRLEGPKAQNRLAIAVASIAVSLLDPSSTSGTMRFAPILAFIAAASAAGIPGIVAGKCEAGDNICRWEGIRLAVGGGSTNHGWLHSAVRVLVRITTRAIEFVVISELKGHSAPVDVLGAELLEQAVAGDSDSVHTFSGN
ncbi:hypothetical protein PCL_09442 [Purpureocillium lilacinum]|uniref:Uncharacterized protein n=1 Tax=Purpureocillium lilacinum TaxID=33203 RepID=A0A2U3EI41_PURLI|nr:hypothetical protein PCL_09442 [Purpureocillium lilacinum]